MEFMNIFHVFKYALTETILSEEAYNLNVAIIKNSDKHYGQYFLEEKCANITGIIQSKPRAFLLKLTANFLFLK